MIYRVYLRSHAPDETGHVSDKTNTTNPETAVTAFRALLAIDDLIGRPCAAVLSVGHAVYFSRFNRELGDGRIHPLAPLNPYRTDDGTAEATAWRPAGAPDWEEDPRSLADCLKAWHGRPGWSRQRAAFELRISLPAYHGWCAGKPAEHEHMTRRMMTLINGTKTHYRPHL